MEILLLKYFRGYLCFEKDNKNKEKFYKALEIQQRLIDVDEIVHEKLEGIDENIPGSNTELD